MKSTEFKRSSIFDDIGPEKKDNHVDTQIDNHIDVSTDVDTHKHTHKQDVGKKKPRERKKRRVQILTFDSLIERMDAAAAEEELSRAELFEKIVSEYLDKNHP